MTPFGKLVIETLVLIQEVALDRTQLPPSQREKTSAASKGSEQKGDFSKRVGWTVKDGWYKQVSTHVAGNSGTVLTGLQGRLSAFPVVF